MYRINFYFLLFFLFLNSIFLSCHGSQNWLSFRGYYGRGYTSENLEPPLGQLWKLQLQVDEQETSSFNPPIVQGDMIYFGSSDKNFYALDIRSGYMKWIFQAKNEVNSIPCLDKDSIYFGSDDGNVYAVDLDTGQKQWSFKTQGKVTSLISCFNELIIFTSDLDATYLLDKKGSLQRKIDNAKWSHHTFQVYKDIIYWVPHGDRFGAYDLKTSQFLWDADIADNAIFAWYSFPAIVDDYIYYASNTFNTSGILLTYYALERETGYIHWTRKYAFEWSPQVEQNVYEGIYKHIEILDYMAPSIWNDLVIFSSGDSLIRAFNRFTGDLVWTKTIPSHTSSALTIAGDRVYFGINSSENEAPKLVCLSAKTGDSLWEIDVEGFILSAPVIANDRIFFGTNLNFFYVLEEIF